MNHKQNNINIKTTHLITLLYLLIEILQMLESSRLCACVCVCVCVCPEVNYVVL